MAGKKGVDNTKKVAGNAKKAEAAAQKAAVEDQKKAAADATEWSKGAKSNSKKEAEAAKKEEAARKKAEKAALEAEDDASTPNKGGPKNSKTATKKTGRGTLDLSSLDAAMPSLSGSGIDNALDVFDVASGSQDKVDKHPERRFKAAYNAYEERRLSEMESDGSGDGLRLNQKKDRIRKEFEKSPDNPFNQVSAQYNASREEVSDIRQKEKAKIESRLGSK